MSLARTSKLGISYGRVIVERMEGTMWNITNTQLTNAAPCQTLSPTDILFYFAIGFQLVGLGWRSGSMSALAST